MNGEFSQMREDDLERATERLEQIEMSDPLFLPDDPNPGDSIGQIVAMVACAIAFCVLLYVVLWIPE